MKPTILITRSKYDDAMEYLFHYSEEIIKTAEGKNFKVLDLCRPRLTKENFTAMIKTNNPSFVVFNAHGTQSQILGDKMGGSEEVLIEENKNHNLLDSRIVYARSCWSAKSLGKSCKDGCFIGYNVPFIFLVEQEHSATPLKDKTAKTIIEPSNLVVISLIKGNDAQDSVKKSKALSKKTMLKLLDMNNEQETSAIITCLWSNMEGLEIIGDENMKIEQ